MATYVVEFRIKNDANEVMPSLQAIQAETLPLASREVEKVLATGTADEAVIYEPVRVLRASRRVEVTDMKGRTAADRTETVAVESQGTS
jgi:hypothetical protein